MVKSGNMIMNGIRSSLEELWSALDSLFEEMSPADWQRPHGPDWIFADLPYHLSYIDRYCVARPIELGEALPAAEQVQLRSLNELNAWNQGKFAARPEGQKVERSLEQMYESWEYVRKVTAAMLIWPTRPGFLCSICVASVLLKSHWRSAQAIHGNIWRKLVSVMDMLER